MVYPQSEIRPPDIERLRQWVEAETGMDLGGSRFPRLNSALQKILSQRPGMTIDRLLPPSSEHAAFLENLTAELTVGESFFFRNEHHFRAIRDHVFPEIMRVNAPKREIRVWSAGCATGEEPFSIAILLDQMLAERGNWQISVLGTDLNLDFLDRARQAKYRQWSFRQTNIHENPQYFSSDGEYFKLSPKIRELTRFGYLNLVKDVYPSVLNGTLGLDLILFRNVAIYLKPEVTKAIIERFTRALRPGGWLLLGEVELSLTPASGLEHKQFDHATFFRKPLDSSEPMASVPVFGQAPMPILLSSKAIVSMGPPVPTWGPLPWSGTAAPAEKAVLHPETGYWEQVERHALQKDFVEAERALRRIAPIKERAKYRVRYVRLLLGRAELGRAREMIDICLREEPMLIEAHFWKASFAEEAGDLEGAEKAYRRALYLDRQCPMAHFHLGLVLQQKGDQAGARRSLQTTMELIDGKGGNELVEFGEGICYGRLKEMANLMISSSFTGTSKKDGIH